MLLESLHDTLWQSRSLKSIIGVKVKWPQKEASVLLQENEGQAEYREPEET